MRFMVRPLFRRLSIARGAACVAAGCAVLAGIVAPGAAAQAIAAAAAAAAAAPGKTLRYAFDTAETGFDPAQISDIYSRYITAEIFEAPVRRAYLAVPGTLEPATAAAMPEVSADFRVFTIHLKPGIYFTDDAAFGGRRRELVAADYVYSYKRFFDPHWKSPELGELEPFDIIGMKALRQAAIATGRFDYDKPIEGLRALDRYTFQFRLGVPQPRFVDDLADSSLKGAVAREVVERYGDSIAQHPVGTGGFRLVEWVHSSRIVLERNPAYRTDIFHGTPDPADADAGRIARRLEGRRLPIIDRVVVSIIEESQPRWLSFLNAEHDLLLMMPLDLASLALPGNRPAPMLLRRGIRIERRPRIDVTVLIFNMDDPVIGGYTPEKIALRRAIGLGYDTAELIRTYYQFEAFPAQSMVMPATYGYDPALRTEMGTTDVARANALLDEFGFKVPAGARRRALPSGAPFKITITSQSDQRSRISDEIMHKSLTRLGIDCEFKPAKWPENLKSVRAGNFQVWTLANSSAGPDSSSALRWGYGPAAGADNLSRFSLSAYDELWRRQDRLPDGPERAATIRQMQKILIAYMPMKNPVHRYGIDMTQPWVLNYRHWPFVIDFWRYVDIDPDARRGAARDGTARGGGGGE
jgi:ABC-type transport system substrate-binding protein